MRLILMAILAAGLLTSCHYNNEYTKYVNDPLLYCKTVKRLNDVVLENNFAPMVASRNYVYANIAAYECMAAGNPRYRTLAGQIGRAHV